MSTLQEVKLKVSTTLLAGLLVSAGLAYSVPAVALVASQPVAEAGYIEFVRTLDDREPGLQNASGLAFSPEDELFFVVQTPGSGGINVAAITPYGDITDSTNVDGSVPDAASVAFDRRTGRLWLGSASNELVGLLTSPSGRLDTSPGSWARVGLGPLNPQRLRGIAFDPHSGDLYLLDAGGQAIFRIRPDALGGYDGAEASDHGRVSRIDLRPMGLVEPSGLAFNPDDGTLYVLDGAGQRMVELSTAGEVLKEFDLAGLGLAAPRGLVFAPSADPTDDPSRVDLYLVDSAASVVELSLTPTVQAISAPTVQATLIRTTNTSAFQPPSPDSAGIAYVAAWNSLIISDCEVDEIPSRFTGKNVYRASLSGTLISTWSTTAFSYEPTGVAYNPVNGHLFYSDDDWMRVFEVAEGPDGIQGTTDDIVTYFSTNAFGSSDPEGITYDTALGCLDVVDGTAMEIYQVCPGLNGRFDGVPLKGGDDVVTHFDTSTLGARDPEGVEYNPDNGYLYILSQLSDVILETTRTGSLIRVISTGSIPLVAAAGLAYAPASSGPADNHFYVVDRGVDNGVNPNENDGKMFELSVPFEAVTTTPTTQPSSTPTATQTLTPTPGSSDTPTATRTHTPSTEPSSTPIALETPTPTPTTSTVTTISVQVSSSSDDAEESVGDKLMDLNSSDLELGTEANSAQIVGMRFNNLRIAPGALIISAFVEFEVDETGSTATSVRIFGQADDNPVTFSAAAGNISQRPKTTAWVDWNDMAPWDTIDAKQQTADISPLIQEIVDRPNWLSGNSLVLMIDGSGTRTAEAYDGEILGAPKLVVSYATDPFPTPIPTSTPTLTSQPTSTPSATGTSTSTVAPSGTPTATNTLTATTEPSSTPTATSTLAPTRTPTVTFTPTVTATPTQPSTGYRSPSENAAVTLDSGDNNGFESNPARAYASDNRYAVDSNSGTATGTPTPYPSPEKNPQKDRHQFYNFGLDVPAGAKITGIEVRLDARIDRVSDSPMMYVELSWDGGNSWTAAKATPTLGRSRATYVLGNASDTWGREWTTGELADVRVRITDVAASIERDFSLDWVAVRVSYLP